MLCGCSCGTLGVGGLGAATGIGGLGALVGRGAGCCARQRHCRGSRVTCWYVIGRSVSGLCRLLVVSVTLGGDAVGVVWMADTESNRGASVSSAASLSGSSPAKGLAGVGFYRALISALAACVAASVLVVAGMLTWCGNHSRVSTVRPAPVSLMYTL